MSAQTISRKQNLKILRNLNRVLFDIRPDVNKLVIKLCKLDEVASDIDDAEQTEIDDDHVDDEDESAHHNIEYLYARVLKIKCCLEFVQSKLERRKELNLRLEKKEDK